MQAYERLQNEFVLLKMLPCFFQNCVPTAENIALYISDVLKNPIHELGATLHKIRLQESPNNAAEIYVDQKLTNSLNLKFENSLVTQT